MQSTMLNSAMRYGFVFGLLFSLNFLFSLSHNILLAFLTYILVPLILYATYRITKTYRDTDCGGAISYRHALLYIMLLFFFGSLISALVKYIFCKYINPDFLTNMTAQSVAMMEQIMPSMAHEVRDNMDKMITPFYYSMGVIWMNLFFGFFIGLITAGIVKKEKNIFNDNQNPQQ